MRSKIITLLAISAFLSCKQPESPEVKIKQIIQGVWDDKIEFEKIQTELERAAKTNTPVKRDTSNPRIITLDIETDRIFSDIVPIDVGLSNGDGTGINFILHSGKYPNSILTAKNLEIAYKIKGIDTTLILYRPDNGKMVSREFVRTMRAFPRLE
ncbi:hypothetical protein ACFS5N_13875 [Mucilaginibacter ximonensis]|uniref:Lipoprotein n=1 Tax=Mucilaginibacter ximonensis TaxID=538021 RepID=A0ABW5YDV1_9SPHI